MLVAKYNITDPINIGNMDETPTYFDMPSKMTFDLRGVKVVRLKSTGNPILS